MTHAQMYAKSRVINGRGPYTADKVETEVYRLLLPTFQKTINEAMTTMANEVKINETQLCQAFAENSQAVSEIFLLSKLNPVLYQAMSEAK